MRRNRFDSHLSGLLIVDKPEGPTSFDIVRKIRNALRVKKVGHTGTLDPMATGVLILCVNRATKLVPFLQTGDKVYEGRMILGLTTDTDDITGRVSTKRVVTGISREDIEEAASEFIGTIEQVPSSYAALKYNGQPGYKLARKGEKVPPRARQVVVHELTVDEVNLPKVSFVTRVSKGTYIRSLAADWGRRLGSGACLERLRRLANASFSVAQAVSLEEALNLAAEGRLHERLIPVEEALSFMPAVEVDRRLAVLVENGQPIPLSHLKRTGPPVGPVRVMAPESGLLAVYECHSPMLGKSEEFLTPLRVLTG
jgi:tRNA pseudouridine55 synthase